MILVYGGPTTGKSTACEALDKQGYATLDTDHLVEALISPALNLNAEQHHEAWLWWKEQPKEVKEPVIAQIRMIIAKLARPDRPSNIIVFTNLHWPEMKADLAFYRSPELTLELMKERSGRKGQVISPSYETQILGWLKPDIGSEITELGAGAFIDPSDVLDLYRSKHPLQ